MLAALETSPRMSSLGQPACFRRNEWPLIVMEFLLGRMTSLLVRECVLYDEPHAHTFALYQPCGAIGSFSHLRWLELCFVQDRLVTSHRPLHNASIRMLASFHIPSRPLR
jgi:hypothetical protein